MDGDLEKEKLAMDNNHDMDMKKLEYNSQFKNSQFEEEAKEREFERNLKCG